MNSKHKKAYRESEIKVHLQLVKFKTYQAKFGEGHPIGADSGGRVDPPIHLLSIVGKHCVCTTLEEEASKGRLPP